MRIRENPRLNSGLELDPGNQLAGSGLHGKSAGVDISKPADSLAVGDYLRRCGVGRTGIVHLQSVEHIGQLNPNVQAGFLGHSESPAQTHAFAGTAPGTIVVIVCG